MSQDSKKKAAAWAALDHVVPGMTLGVGTGSTVNHFIDALATLREPVAAAVASSEATARRLTDAGIRVVDLNDVEGLALYVDGADEANASGQLIKGGGGALTREKIVAAASERFICIIDDSKLVERLGEFPVAIEVVPMALAQVARRVAALGGRPVPRAGFVTDNGNAIIDAHGLALDDPAKVEARLDAIAGVVANGLFCRRPADLLVVGREDGAAVLG